MPPRDRILSRVIGARADTNIRFSSLRQLLLRFGFDERIRGSHHIFRKQGVDDLINLQRDGSHAKAYQVRQVRTILLRLLESGDY